MGEYFLWLVLTDQKSDAEIFFVWHCYMKWSKDNDYDSLGSWFPLECDVTE